MLPVAHSEKRANGTDSGSESRMVKGMDQALELRGQDHVHEDDREHEGEEEFAEGAFQLAAAAGDGASSRPGGRFISSAACAAPPGGRPGRSPGPTPARRLTCRWRSSRSMREAVVASSSLHQVVEPHEPARCRRHVEPPDGVRVVARPLGEPQLHVVVVVDSPGRGSGRPRWSPPTMRRSAVAMSVDLDAEVWRRGRGRSRPAAPACRACSVVSASTMPPSSGALRRSCSA